MDRHRASDVRFVLPVLDERSAPILLLISPPVLDLAWVAEQRRAFEAYYARNERFAVISYSGFVRTVPGASERKALAEWTNDTQVRQTQQRLCVAASTQIDSAPKRAFLQALLWMWDPPYPHVVHATLEDSIVWCSARLTDAGVHVPARLREKIVHDVRAMHAAHARSDTAVPRIRAGR